MSALIDRLRAPLADAVGDQGWIVGGAVRDALRGVPADDVDLAVTTDAEPLARRLAAAHGAGRFQLSSDFASWRVHGGRLPFTVDITPLQGDDLAEDLGRRDFSVNAMAVSLAEGALIDPVGGRADLLAGVLRIAGPEAFRRDPVRLMRLVRFARQVRLRPDPGTLAAARQAAPLLGDAPPERIIDELARTIHLRDIGASLALMDEAGVLTTLVPELEHGRGMEQNPYHHKDVLGHILEVVERVERIADDPEPVFRSVAPRVAERLEAPLAGDFSRRDGLVLAALFHDVAKPATRAVTPEGRVTFMGHDALGAEMAERWCERCRLARRVTALITNCVRNHLRLGFLVHRQPLSLRQIDRYLLSVAPEEVELGVLTAADRLATQGPRTRRAAIDRHLALVREITATHFALVDRGPVRPPVDGARIAHELGRDPGPWLKDLLVALREETLVGRISSAERAISFAKTWVSDVSGDGSPGD